MPFHLDSSYYVFYGPWFDAGGKFENHFKFTPADIFSTPCNQPLSHKVYFNRLRFRLEVKNRVGFIINLLDEERESFFPYTVLKEFSML